MKQGQTAGRYCPFCEALSAVRRKHFSLDVFFFMAVFLWIIGGVVYVLHWFRSPRIFCRRCGAMTVHSQEVSRSISTPLLDRTPQTVVFEGHPSYWNLTELVVLLGLISFIVGISEFPLLLVIVAPPIVVGIIVGVVRNKTTHYRVTTERIQVSALAPRAPSGRRHHYRVTTERIQVSGLYRWLHSDLKEYVQAGIAYPIKDRLHHGEMIREVAVSDVLEVIAKSRTTCPWLQAIWVIARGSNWPVVLGDVPRWHKLDRRIRDLVGIGDLPR